MFWLEVHLVVVREVTTFAEADRLGAYGTMQYITVHLQPPREGP